MIAQGTTTGVRLQEKVILVTGSTTGIGEGMARLFAAQGAKVMVHGRRRDAAEQLAQELGNGSNFVVGSLEDAGIPDQLIAQTVAHFGRIDGLVNNAAIMTRGGLEETDADAFDHTIAINLKAPFLLARAALPHFRRQGGGRVLNIGSVNAYCGEKSMCAYSICKGALMTFTRNLADAYGPEGIRVNQLNVGWTLTPNERALKATEGLPEDWPSKLPAAFAPSGRLLSPKDIAWAGVYFLSDEAELINGAIVDLEQYPMIGRNPPKEVVS
jgi:NAD(P)-dependent dehydrogenase (short-subunit alcohol dehydrogenase family)